MTDTRVNFENYERRIRHLGLEYFEALRGKWLTTFDVYGSFVTSDFIDGAIVFPNNAMQCTAFIIARVAHERGVEVRGVLSERTRNDVFVCPIRDALVPSDFVYVGPHNHFTSNSATIWSVAAVDRVVRQESATK